jgi:GntR family transcriptional regulator/MocR family aminotransferase
VVAELGASVRAVQQLAMADLIARGGYDRHIRRRRRAGVALHGPHADGYWREPGGDRPAALIIGYATPPPHAWSRALEALAEVVQLPFVPEGVEAMTVRLGDARLRGRRGTRAAA